jgi:hypothetical protein
LIAYYQFNNTQNFGLLYDKKNANDLTLSSSITFPTSTAPVGIGTSQLLTVNTAGTYNFSGANASLNFSSATPNGKVVVSKLNVLPNEAPATNAVANEYWILNNYGTNLTFSGLTTADLQTATNVSAYTPGNFSVYKRNSNGHLQVGWTQDAAATSINTNTLRFPGSGLNQSFQWFVGSNVTLGVEDVTPQATLTVYPNPYIQSQQLNVKGMNSHFTFTLYDVNGKLVVKKPMTTNEIKLDKVIAKGLYFYRIESDTKIFNGRLIVD